MVELAGGVILCCLAILACVFTGWTLKVMFGPPEPSDLKKNEDHLYKMAFDIQSIKLWAKDPSNTDKQVRDSLRLLFNDPIEKPKRRLDE